MTNISLSLAKFDRNNFRLRVDSFMFAMHSYQNRQNKTLVEIVKAKTLTHGLLEVFSLLLFRN